jgi:DnaA family protein
LNIQLPLGFKSKVEQGFIAYLNNSEARNSLELAAAGHFEHNIFLAGVSGSGKTHLLKAAVAHSLLLARRAAYVPVLKMAAHLPQILEGFEQHALICLDDVQAIAGQLDAEHALFHFFNRAKAAGCCLVFSAHTMPAALSLQLPDLQSRLQQSARFTLELLDEPNKRQVVLQHAKSRGLELDDAVLDYLFSRVSRDLHTLSELLERVDRASLAAQRRVTVPFIRTLL